MSITDKPAIRILAKTLGDILIFLRPKKARQLSKNRITLIHMNKNTLSTQERLMRYSLVKKLDKIQDYNTIAELNRNFWINNDATIHFLETKDFFETIFLTKFTFIFDILKKKLQTQSEEFTTLVEIGTGNGDVLNYLSSSFPKINRFVGIDLSFDQIKINKKKFNKNKKLEFVASDAFDWVKEHGQSNTIFVSSNGVLEYFKQERLESFLKEINRLGSTIFIAMEPNRVEHDLETNVNTLLYGDEPSFSHNYPKLFKSAGFNLWHFSQDSSWAGVGNTQTFIIAKN